MPQKYTNKIIHDIKNMKMFTKDDIIEINKLSFENRMLILLEYNNMMKSITSMLENM